MKTKSISIVLVCLAALIGGCELLPSAAGFPGPDEPCYDLNNACAVPASSQVKLD